MAKREMADKAEKTSRRNVFPLHEIAHLWAHSIETGRNSARSTGAGNFYFDRNSDNEPVLWSYGRHSAVARLTTSPVTGAKIALVNSHTSRSVTNSGHISAALRAIPPGVIVLQVPAVDFPAHGENLAYLREEFTRLRGEMARARDLAGWLAMATEKALDVYDGYREQFSPAAPALDVTGLQEETASARARADKHATLQEAKQARASASRQAARAAQALQDAKTFSEKLADWKANKCGQYTCPPCQTIHLRQRDQSHVETSRGAVFPLSDARRVFDFLQWLEGAEYAAPATGNVFLGDYRIDAIDAEGNVHAGCHFVPFSSIQDFAIRAGWIEAPAMA